MMSGSSQRVPWPTTSSSGAGNPDNPSIGHSDVEMFDTDDLNDPSNPFYIPPFQRPSITPNSPDDDDFEGDPTRASFIATSSQDPQQAGLRQFRSSLAVPPPTLTMEGTTEPQDDERDGDSPMSAFHHRRRAISGIDPASRPGLRAFTIQAGGQPHRTPPKPMTTLDFPDDRDLKTQGTTLLAELGPVLDADPSFIMGKKFLLSRKLENKINDWVAKGAGAVKDPKTGRMSGGAWDPTKKRWILPARPSKEWKIYKPMLKVIGNIITDFVNVECTPGVEREVTDTHKLRFQHKESNYTSPDLVVGATGPSFEKPEDSEIGYSNIVTFFDVKREVDMGGRDAHIKQLSVYARQLLAHQPNRMFIRCLLLSENTCRLIHFDRSGAQVSPPINIHKQYPVFIRLIAVLCSGNEKTIGFDDSIQWILDPNTGRKISGFLRYKPVPGVGVPVTYDLVDLQPIAVHVIRGRATTCWQVRDDAGNEYVVKDSWTTEGRTPEYDYLLKALGFEGVVQYVSHETDRGQTANYRCNVCVASPYFGNRIASRIMMRAYGKHLQHFKSVLQLLAAFYDAIAGHLKLSAKARILHRDINDRNVLLGRENARVGWRGVLIDLNVAIDFENLREIAKEARMGSRFFQSCSTLDYLTDLTSDTPPAHDYLDNLEAFFYLLCWVLLQFSANGERRPADDPARKIIDGWGSENVKEALHCKSSLFNRGRRQKQIAMDCIRAGWGEPCAVLFVERCKYDPL